MPTETSGRNAEEGKAQTRGVGAILLFGGEEGSRGENRKNPFTTSETVLPGTKCSGKSRLGNKNVGRSPKQCQKEPEMAMKIRYTDSRVYSLRRGRCPHGKNKPKKRRVPTNPDITKHGKESARRAKGESDISD